MAKKGTAIFLVYTDMDAAHEQEFNAWYDTEHLPDLAKLPGFLDAARYVAVKGGPKYLAAYELESADVLERPEFQNYRANPTPWSRRILPLMRANNFTRTLGQQIFPTSTESANRGFAPALQIGRMSVSDDVEREWNEWYSGEYVPGYRKVPGVIYARRYRIIEGETKYATVYEFEHEKVSETPDWNKQRDGSSPRSGKMRDAMTHAKGSPGVYRRIHPAS